MKQKGVNWQAVAAAVLQSVVDTRRSGGFAVDENGRLIDDIPQEDIPYEADSILMDPCVRYAPIDDTNDDDQAVFVKEE